MADVVTRKRHFAGENQHADFTTEEMASLLISGESKHDGEYVEFVNNTCHLWAQRANEEGEDMEEQVGKYRDLVAGLGPLGVMQVAAEIHGEGA